MPKNATAADPSRNLMIKTKTCQRLQKEVTYYQKEVTENEEKLEEMKKQNKNPFDIKKFQEVLDESHMMVPDSQRRFEEALRDLRTFLESINEEDETVTSSEWYQPAMELIKGMDGGITQDIAIADDAVVEVTDVSNLQDGEAF
ncbi:tubulin binding cofactor A [Nitzschia inconspicua]|uniref:Tubulin-specific chaperone A n=1 Tax=Nitzschia inconspicua TaxID=303405 RepID=A0A9K3KI74_9STRA|nr:tubulin binding cofactor A [Nitzschia inconspicua]